MTIAHQGPGTVLVLSREELPSSALTREEVLPMLRALLSRAGRPLPQAAEIRVFSCPQGALFLILPGFDRPGQKNFFPLSPS